MKYNIRYTVYSIHYTYLFDIYCIFLIYHIMSVSQCNIYIYMTSIRTLYTKLNEYNILSWRDYIKKYLLYGWIGTKTVKSRLGTLACYRRFIQDTKIKLNVHIIIILRQSPRYRIIFINILLYRVLVYHKFKRTSLYYT